MSESRNCLQSKKERNKKKKKGQHSVSGLKGENVSSHLYFGFYPNKTTSGAQELKYSFNLQKKKFSPETYTLIM